MLGWILFDLAAVAGAVWFGVQVRRASGYVEDVLREEAGRSER